MPWNAEYELILSGAAGSSSTGIQGGNGYKLSKRVFLHKGDKLEWTVGSKGGYCPSGTISRGGGMSTLKVNGELVWIAAGGAGAVPVNTGGSPYVLQGGQGNPGGTNGSVTYHVHGSGCYGYRDHEHTDSCHYHIEFHPYSNCGCCRHYPPCEHYACEGFRAHDCDREPNTDWGLKCGKTATTIDSITQAQPGTCFVKDSWRPTDASLSVTGNGSFSIRLAECQNLYYNRVVAKQPKWLNSPVYLLILDDTVVYYKRR